MVPRKKTPRPNPKTTQYEAEEKEEKEDHSIEFGGKGITVNFPIDRRSGIVLAYAVAFAIVFGTIGWVVFQIITALKISGGSVQQSVGFVLCSLIAFLFALVSRS